MVKTRNFDGYAIDSSKFQWHPETDTMSAEASELQGAFKLHQIYDDAADVGIAVRSQKTRSVEIFYLYNVDEKDGDVRAWEFKPVNKNLRVNIVVFND